MSFTTNISVGENITKVGFNYRLILKRLREYPETLNANEYKLIESAVKRYEQSCFYNKTPLIRRALKEPIEHWIAALEYMIPHAISSRVAEIVPEKKQAVTPKVVYYKHHNSSPQNPAYRVTYRYLGLTKNEWKRHILNSYKKAFGFNVRNGFTEEQSKILHILSYTRITYQLVYNHDIYSWLDENFQLQIKISLGYGLAGLLKLFGWSNKGSCSIYPAFSEEDNTPTLQRT